MQRAIHQYRNCSPVFTLLESIYAHVSDTNNECGDVVWVNKYFTNLCEILSENLFSFVAPKVKPIIFPEVQYSDPETKEVVVCLSGGKDSAAAAYFFQKCGYKVHLYHVTGVNKAYGDEKKAAEKIAQYLGCDLFIDKIQLVGTQPFIEHPMKNYIIANGAIHYALARKYPLNIVFGNFTGSHLDDNPFEVCAGDCVEMWDAYKEIVKSVLPSFELILPLSSNADTFRLLEDDWELFGLCVSCMSPFRFRAHWKHRTEERYNVRIFENRCGCCWKCCIEEIWLMDIGKMEYNVDFFGHCLGILLQTIFKESDEMVSLQSAWLNYMWYPIEDSHAKDFLSKDIIYCKDKACMFVDW